MNARIRRTSRAVAVAVPLMVITPLAALGGEDDPECPPYVSCDQSEPCWGELNGEIIIDLRDIEFEWGGIFSVWMDLDFCAMSCTYEVHFGDGTVEDVEFDNLDCEDFET